MLADSSNITTQDRWVRSNIAFTILITLLQSGCAIDTSRQRAQTASVSDVSFAPSLGSVSYFEKNNGQTDDAVLYLSREHGYQLFLTASETVLALHTRDKQRPTPAQANVKQSARKRVLDDKSFTPDMTVLRMRLVGVREDVTVTGEQKLRTKVNYYRGADPNKWQQDVPTYARVRQSDVYPGIDLVFSHTKGQVRYSFHIAPGADPAVIKMAFSGADKVRLNAKGDLVLETQAGEFHHSSPRIYQIINGVEQLIPGGFALHEGKVSFHIPVFDATRPLVIDPNFTFSGFVGGPATPIYEWDPLEDADEWFAGGNYYNHVRTKAGLASRGDGEVYMAGSTASAEFPVTDNAQFAGSWDAYVARLDLSDPTDPSAGLPTCATYLGGIGMDLARDIALDSDGHSYVTGTTYSQESFPVSEEPYQAGSAGASDAYLTRLNSDCRLVYSTYLGGEGYDRGNGIAVEDTPGGNTVVTIVGETRSPVFQTTVEPLGEYGGERDAFVLQMDGLGSTISAFAYLGGKRDDSAYDVAIRDGRIYVVGETWSPHFPLTLPFDACMNYDPAPFSGDCPTQSQPPPDAFIAAIHGGFDGLDFATFLGSDGNDLAMGVDVDPAGNPIVIGTTEPISSRLPVAPLGYDATYNGGMDPFVAKFSANGQSLLYLTYLGGPYREWGTDIFVRGDFAYVTGSLESGNNFSPNPPFAVNPNPVSKDVFIAKLDTSISGPTGMDYWAHIGGFFWDYAFAISNDDQNSIYVSGATQESGFWPPTWNAMSGVVDHFLVKLEEAPGPQIGILKTDSPDPVEVGQNVTYTITIDNTGSHDATSVTVTDLLDPSDVIDLQSVTSNRGICILNDDEGFYCTLASLGEGETMTIGLEGIVIGTAETEKQQSVSVVNQVAVGWSDPIMGPASTATSETTTVEPLLGTADLAMVQEHTSSMLPATPGPGEMVEFPSTRIFVLRARNNGPDTVDVAQMNASFGGGRIVEAIVATTGEQCGILDSLRVSCNLSNMSADSEIPLHITVVGYLYFLDGQMMWSVPNSGRFEISSDGYNDTNLGNNVYEFP